MNFMQEYNIFYGTRAVIFDFDNTLVEFNYYSRKALEAVAKDMSDYFNDISFSPGYEKILSILISVSEKLDSEGVYDRTKWWEEALKELNLKVEKDQLYDWTSLYWSIASNNPVYDDAREIIEYLKSKGYKLGILTNDDGEGGNKLQRIKKVDISSYFDKIVIAGTNGVKPKPNIQPFVYICEQLNEKVENCTMIGDDPVKDCLAAKKAGLKSILIDRESKVKFAELYADYVIRSLRELEEFL